MPLNDDTIFEVARHYRFQWEPAQQMHVLLYPEGMVKLPGSSGEILKRVNGTASVSEIVACLGAPSRERLFLADPRPLAGEHVTPDVVRVPG